MGKLEIFFWSLLNSRHHKLWGILSNPGHSGGEEGGRDGYAEKRQDAAAGREKNGEAESQITHRRRLWVAGIHVGNVWSCKLWISWSFTFLNVTTLSFFRFSLNFFFILWHIVLVRFRHKSFFRVFYPVVSHRQPLNCCGPSLNTSWLASHFTKVGTQSRNASEVLQPSHSQLRHHPTPTSRYESQVISCRNVGTVNLFNQATRLTHVKGWIEYTQQVAHISSCPGRNSVQASRCYKICLFFVSRTWAQLPFTPPARFAFLPSSL